MQGKGIAQSNTKIVILYRKFHSAVWTNILAISFSFLEIKDTLKYRTLSRVFNKSIQYNAKFLVNIEETEKERFDVKKLSKKFKQIYNNL